MINSRHLRNWIVRALVCTLTLLVFLYCAPTARDPALNPRLYADQEDQCVWTDVDKIVAVGDIHGDYKNFVTILKRVNLVDEDLHWIGGKAHLVQTGDVLDRGPDARMVFDMIMRLEKEAEEAGGRVHMLIGNHEEMNLTGIAHSQVGYVTVEQFVSFLSDDYRAQKERKIREKYSYKKTDDEGNDGALEAEIKRFWNQFMQDERNDPARVYFEQFDAAYGDWIIAHKAVIRINDIIFVHGGISESFSTWSLEEINRTAKEELVTFREAYINQQILEFEKNLIVYNDQGPFWFRGLAMWDEDDYKEDVDRILKNLGAEYMVIAHTPRKGIILSRFKDRIWIIDTGISDVYGGYLNALVIENGRLQPKELE